VCHFLYFTSCIFLHICHLVCQGRDTEQRGVIFAEESYQFGIPYLCLDTFVLIVNCKLVSCDMMLY